MAAVMQPYPLLEWAGRSVSGDLAPYVKSLSYTDVLEDGEAGRDSFSLVLDNRERIFMNAWKPSAGDIIKPGIGWQQAGTHQWLWGRFVIDAIQFRLSPDEVIVSGSAQPVNQAALENVQTRCWDTITLHALLEQLAREADCNVIIHAMPDKALTHIEQRAESSRALLKRLASDHNVPMNFKNGDLHVGAPSTLPTLDIDVTNRHILASADLPESQKRRYRAVTVHYYDEQTAKSSTYTAGDPSEGQTQTLYNLPVSSVEEARDYANAQLTEAGQKQTAHGSLSLIATPISAGQRVRLLNVGQVHPDWTIISQTTSLRRGSWSATASIARA